MPFEIAGKPQTDREGYLLHLMSSEGRQGWGEMAPLAGVHRESLTDVRMQLGAVKNILDGLSTEPVDPCRDGFGVLPGIEKLPPSIRWGIEQALFGLMDEEIDKFDPSDSPGMAALTQLPELTNDKKRSALLQWLHDHGGTTLKIKIGRQPWREEVQRLVQLQDLLPDGIRWRLDGNRRFRWEDYREFENAVQHLPIDFIEDPLQDPQDYLRRFHTWQLPLAVDEGLWDLDAQTLPPFVWYILKPTRIGGVAAIHRWHRAVGPNIILSSTFDTPATVNFMMRLAQRLDLKQDQGMGTLRYMAAFDQNSLREVSL